MQCNLNLFVFVQSTWGDRLWLISIVWFVILVFLNKWQIRIKYTDSNRYHDHVIKWKHFPRYWPFVRGIHRPVTRSFDVYFDARINGWVNNRAAGDLGHHHAHYDVIVMITTTIIILHGDVTTITTASVVCFLPTLVPVINTLRPRQNGRHFPDDIFKSIFLIGDV